MVLLLSIVTHLFSSRLSAQTMLSLEQAVLTAQTNDHWLQGNVLRQSAVEAQSTASGTLPDPQISVGLLNLPSDSWAFDQEAMTQFKIGISQTFPRGEVLALRQSQLKIDAGKFPLLRENRKAQLKASVTQLWLDVYLAQSIITLINDDTALFEQMVDVAKASYSSGIGKTRQQDVIRAQLELVQLDDRLTMQYQKMESAAAQLNQWLYQDTHQAVQYTINFDPPTSTFLVANTLPSTALKLKEVDTNIDFSRQQLAQLLLFHPSIMVIDINQQVAEKDVALANEQYKPQWGVNASYAIRENGQVDVNRADLFSVGITLDLPLFGSKRQDNLVKASVAESEAIKTDKLLAIKNMLSRAEKEIRQLKRLQQRQSLYNSQLLKQTHEQAEASLTAYTNDDGSFTEVVRAKITELNTRVSALQIQVDTLKTIARLNYIFTQSQHPQKYINGESR